MRVIIAGSRNAFLSPAVVDDIVARSGFDITTLLSGTARGGDRLGEAWASRHGVKIEWYDAKWNEHGRAAGPIRNRQMCLDAQGLIAIWNGSSPGTRNIILTAQAMKIRTFIWVF